MNYRKFPLSVLSALIVVLLALSACTVDQPSVVVDPETIDETTATDATTADATTADTTTTDMTMTNAGVTDASNVLIVASSLLDYDFNNIDGEVSGEIQDLIIDVDTGNVLYATLEYGGFLDIGDTELPVPLSAFVWGTDGQLILNIDEARLNNFPDLGTDWPNLTTAGWDDDVVNFWNNEGITSVNNFNDVSNSIVRASDTIGYGVGDVGMGAGTVDDMLIDLGTSQVTYALLAYDPTLYGNDLVAVPFNALSLSTAGNELLLDQSIDAATLENAPRVTTDALASGTPGLYNDANTYWGGYGYGYGPGVTTTGEMALNPDDTVAEDTTTMDSGSMNTGDMNGIAGTQDYLMRASTLLGYNVYNLNGDNIGSINNMLINVQNGDILFATIEYGGFLDIGDRVVPIPLSAFEWQSENEVVLVVDEQELDSLPDVGTNWPNVADPSWNDDIVNFWNGIGIDPGYGANDAETIMYVDNLIDFNLTDVGFGDQGSIDDLLIDPSQSKAPYVVVDYGGLFNDELVAVPFGAFDVTQANGEFTFTPNIDLSTLQNAPTIARNNFEQSGLYNRDFTQDWNNYWSNLGYDLGITDSP
ncbi:MAG: PRC-barrel domain-containing protein [Caldilineaceae bacterium]|nr:PRC-barrel domain-containing protein [Caldilineaceae bacterium]